MPIVKELTVVLENRPGALAELCSELAKRAINISAIHVGEATSRSPVRLIVDQVDAAAHVCDALGLKHTAGEVLAVKVANRPGSLGRITRKLAEKGINIEYAYGSIARGSSQAMIVLGVRDVAAASRWLR